MVLAYSRLKQLLDRRRLSVPELHRRIQARGLQVNLKSLYRLNRDDEPLERLDLNVAGAVCQVCEVALSELIGFEQPRPRLRRLSAAKQRRLSGLMTKHEDGKLTPTEARELRDLVQEAEELALSNARLLARQRRRLTSE